MTLTLSIGCGPAATIPPDEVLSCDHCGDSVYGETIDLFDGYIVCGTDCAAALGYKQCHHCGEWHSAGNSYHDPQGNPVCTACFDDNYCICEDCGGTVLTEDSHWIECREKTVCEGCRKEHYVLCHDCGNLFPDKDTYYVDSEDYHVCPTCRDRNYSYCDRCGNLFHYERMDGDYCEDCAGDDDEEDSRIHSYCYKPAYNFLQTKFDSAEHKLYFGFELEIEVENSISNACDVVEELSYLYMKSDASINHGFEIVSHPGTLHYWQQEKQAIGDLLRQLKVLGCDAEPQLAHPHQQRTDAGRSQDSLPVFFRRK